MTPGPDFWYPVRAATLALRAGTVATAMALLLIVTIVTAAPACAAEPVPAPDLYLDAMRSIAEGRQTDASDALARMVALEPLHAGAWLDLAIIQCELGHAVEAERLFEAIVTRFAPPAEILEVIASNRRRGCASWRPSSKFSVLLGRGVDSNVNQGASSPFFNFNFGGALVEAQLLPEYLPHGDQFTVVQSDYSRDLDANGTTGSLQVQARINDHMKQYDAAALILGIDKPWRLGDLAVRSIGSVGFLSLGGKLYQTQAVLQARMTPSLGLPANMQLTVTPGITHVKYPTLTNYDANTAELRGQLTYRLPQWEFNATLGYLADYAVAARPGGDRKGWASGIRANTKITDNTFGELGWSRQTWQSASAYSPGLIDTVRYQDMQVLRATLVHPVRPHQTVQLELRNVRSKDTISIFRYNSTQLQLSWQWQNF